VGNPYILYPQRDCGPAILLLSNQRLRAVFLHINNYLRFLSKIAYIQAIEELSHPQWLKIVSISHPHRAKRKSPKVTHY
jgi:uncharacterized protein YueI